MRDSTRSRKTSKRLNSITGEIRSQVDLESVKQKSKEVNRTKGTTKGDGEGEQRIEEITERKRIAQTEPSTEHMHINKRMNDEESSASVIQQTNQEAIITNLFRTFQEALMAQVKKTNDAVEKVSNKVDELAQKTEKELKEINDKMQANAVEQKEAINRQEKENAKQKVINEQMQQDIGKEKNPNVNENNEPNDEIEQIKNKIIELENREINIETPQRQTQAITKITGTSKKKVKFKRIHEIVLSRIPNEDKLDIEWLKSELKLPTEIKVNEVVQLKPTRYIRQDGKKYPTKSMKVTLETEWTLEEVFKPQYYPEQVVVDRYRNTERERNENQADNTENIARNYLNNPNPYTYTRQSYSTSRRGNSQGRGRGGQYGRY